MRSKSYGDKASLGLKIGAIGTLLFLHVPLWVIFLYSFTTDESTYSFPLPGLTTKWFGVALQRTDLWDALKLSLQVASLATVAALILGTLAAAAVYRSNFFGRDAVSFLLVLPIALPGIVTGIALRSAIGSLEIPFSFWTIIIGHATFCVVVVYNNVLARFRRMQSSQIEASMDLGAKPSQTFRNVILPLAFPGVIAGSIFTFSLTLGDFIVPQSLGNSRFFIGQAVYSHQGTSGNIPLAAAFTMGPVVIMVVYLLIARKLGAFDAL